MLGDRLRAEVEGPVCGDGLSRIKIQRGVPKFLCCDNGREFPNQTTNLWAYQNGVRVAFSRPRKPIDNAFLESFNGTFGAECLDAPLVRVVGGDPADPRDLAQ